MKMKFLTWLGALLWLLMAPSSAWAVVITCTMSGTPAATPSSAYTPYVANNTSLTYTVRCSSIGTNASLDYKIGNDNGSGNPSSNRASFTSGSTTYFLPYDLYTTSSATCGGTLWHTATDLPDKAVMNNGNGRTADTAHTFYLCIPAFSGSPFPVAGTYTDTVKLTMNSTSPSNGDTLFPPANPFATLNVSITVAKECSLPTSPTSVNFGTYNSLTNSDLNANTTFVARCTNQGPYTMSLTGASTGNNTSPVNGVVAGLNYSLGISGAAASGPSIGGATVSTTGSGAGQTYYINGYMVGGQAGSCAGNACLPAGASVSHTLTLTY